MLQNAYFLTKIGADTAENERNFAEKIAQSWQLPQGAAQGAAEGATGEARCGGGRRAGRRAGRAGRRPHGVRG